MPKIEISMMDLNRLLCKSIDVGELKDSILFVKGEIEEINKDVLKIDIKDTNRPDLWSCEGIARELKGFYGIERGLWKCNIKKSAIKIIVDQEIKHVRPFIVGAVVKDAMIDDEAIRQIIQLQEKICQNYGRRRASVAIGVYDCSKIGNTINYVLAEPKTKFVPLGYRKEMTLDKILKVHEKGIEYGHLIRNFDRYPILIDNNGNILSMPPIINSATTGKIEKNTKNIFIDITGTDINKVVLSLNVICSALVDRGGKLYSVEVIDGNSKKVYPEFEYKKIIVNRRYCEHILGIKLGLDNIKYMLEMHRYNVDIDEEKDCVIATIPFYRHDVINRRDVVEDILISYGYNNIMPEEPRIVSNGGVSNISRISNVVREVCIGMGMQEIMTFILTSKKMLKNIGISERIVEIENPISSEYNVMRPFVFPSLLKFLSKNTKSRYPQNVFEIGECVLFDEEYEEKSRTEVHVCIASVSNNSDFSISKSYTEFLATALGLKLFYKASNDSWFIKGRGANIFCGRRKIGFLGEINPCIINKLQIEKPCCIVELNLNNVLREIL